MPKAKVAVTLDAEILARLDRLVRLGAHPSRSAAVEAAVAAHLERASRRRLAAACALADPHEERSWAEMGLSSDLKSWPRY